MISLKLYCEVMLSKLRIGAEEAKAPIATCGYFNLNHAASTARENTHSECGINFNLIYH